MMKPMDSFHRRSSYKSGRKSGGGASSDRRLHGRRPLVTLRLLPPEYKVPANHLIESYIEKEVVLAGIVSPVRVDMDLTSRTEVLRAIDRGKKEQQVLLRTSMDDDAIISVSNNHIKILERDGDESLRLRLFYPQISSVCYVQDDNLSIVCIKCAADHLDEDVPTSDIINQLVVLYCDSKSSAEELCHLMQQCFQQIYLNATMQFLDHKVSEGEEGGGEKLTGKVSLTSTQEGSGSGLPDGPIFLSQSNTDLTRNNSLPRRPSNGANQRTDNDEALIHAYMSLLYHQLQPEELRQFAVLIKRWHTDLSTKDFCDHVLTLYGPHRKNLLAGMRPFIPDRDGSYFELFLNRLGIENTSNASPSMMRSNTNTMASGFTGHT